MRGRTIPVIDLNMAIGRSAIEDMGNGYVIVSEFNRKVQGFLVGGVKQIVNMNWEDIQPPPAGSGKDNYLTAVTRIDGELVEIIDVEKVLAEVIGDSQIVSADIVEQSEEETQQIQKRVLVVDDSLVARKQIATTLAWLLNRPEFS